MAWHRPVFVLLLLLAAGCAGPIPGTAGEERQATVTRVVDGDTVEVNFSGGGSDTVRLLGIDAPEVGGENEPGEFEGVPDTEAGRRCLAGAAHEAAAFAERHLAGASVRVRTDPVADRRDRYGRLLAYVALPNGSDVNYRLVASGHARVYDSTFSRADRFYAVEAEAQAARRGLWRCRAPLGGGGEGSSPLRVAAVHADAAGNDHVNLGDEHLTFLNAGEAPLDLTGWTVRDEADHVYRFPDGFVLAPGATVTLHTGAGDDAAGTLYWGAEDAVWNNDGDTVVVANATGATVVEYSY